MNFAVVELRDLNGVTRGPTATRVFALQLL